MDFIVVCPHCSAYIGVNEYTYDDIDFYFIGSKFMANGELYCNACSKSSVLNMELEPAEYTISKLGE